MKMKLTAVVFKRILIALLVLFVGGAVYGCYMAQNILKATEVEANHAKIEVENGRDELEKMTALQDYLTKHDQEVQRAAAVVAQSTEYRYQDQIVRDINSFARTAGVSVLGFNFPVESAVGKRPAATAGLKTIHADVTLQSVEYTAFLRFLKLIELNLTKMQITDITVSPADANASQIDSPVIGLEVYLQ